MQNPRSPQNPNDADPHPEDIEDRVGTVFFDYRAPREQDRISGVKGPNKEKGTLGTEPTHQRKAEDPHQHASHLNGSQIPSLYLI